MLNQIFATKTTMSQVFSPEGKRLPVTILSLPPQKLVKVVDLKKHGYTALQIAIGQKNQSPNKPLAGNLKASKIKKLPRWIREIRLTDDEQTDLKAGDLLPLDQIIAPGDTIKATSTSKGKGFSGVVKRWNFGGGPKTHGQSDRLRAPGSIGRGTTPGRVLPGKKMAGHMGDSTVSVTNLKVVSLDLEANQLTVSGPIPGPKGALVRLTVTNKAKSE